MRHLTGWPVAAWCVATAISLGGSRAAGGQPGGRQAESAADREIVTLSLDDALGREKALVACLECERGRVARALAVSPAFNTSSHDVDASAIVLADGKVRGELKVTVRPDLWNPKDRQPLACRFTVDAAVADGALGGKYRGTCGEAQVEGSVSGRCRAARPLPDPAGFELVLVKGVSATSTHWGNTAHLGFTLKDGAAVAPKLSAPNNTTYADFTCLVTNIDAEVAGGRLKVELRAQVTPAGSKLCPPGAYVFALDGQVVGDRAAGTFTAACDGRQLAADRFQGTVAPAAIADPAEATYALELHGAAPGGKAMWVHFDAAAGRFPAALAYTPHFNHAVHEVDASGLKVEDGRLRGRLAVTVLPDPYVPKERQPIACVYTIDARTADGGLAGRFHGAFGPEAVAGTVAGQYRPRQELAGPLAISLKMEEGVTGGPPWHNRSYIAFTLDGGKARRGSFANNKDAWTGTFDRADLGLVDGLLAGTIDCTVRTGRVKLGTYTFTLDGHVVGDQLMGDYTSQLDGRVVKSGKFMGTLRPAE